MELVEDGNSAMLRTLQRDLWRQIIACLAWEHLAAALLGW